MKILFLALLSCTFIFGQTIRLTSLEWPPYSGETLPENGLTTLIAKWAFLAMGYKLEVDFFPWNRAVALAHKGESYSGYMPEYYDKNIEDNCYFSNSIGESILGLVEPKDRPISWANLSDLQKYRIGVVQGYVNSHEFDKMVKDGLIRTDVSVNDLQNIKKVAYKRVDAAIIDKYVFEYFLSCQETAKLCKDSLQFNSKEIQIKSLHICFKKDDNGEKLAKIFNEGLQKIDIQKISNNYYQKLDQWLRDNQSQGER